MAHATGLCQSRRGPAPGRCTPQIQSRVSAPACSPKPQWLREEGEAGSSDVQPCAPPARPTVGLPAPAPPLLLCVCIIDAPSSPRLAAAVTAHGGGGHCLLRPDLCPQKQPTPEALDRCGICPARGLRHGGLAALPQPAVGTGLGHPLGEGATGCGPRARQLAACTEPGLCGLRALAPT